MLRPTIAALVTVFAVQVAISGQATAPSFTPLPWSATDQPQGVGTPSADPVTAPDFRRFSPDVNAGPKSDTSAG
jgi:hypothetical protein